MVADATQAPVERLARAGLDRGTAEAAWAGVAELPYVATAIGVLLGGSTAFGLANASSDVDLVVLGADDDPPDAAWAGRAGGRNVNISILTPRQVERLVEEFGRPHLLGALPSDDSAALVHKQRDLADLTGGVVLTGDLAVEDLRRRLPADVLAGLFVEAFAFRQGNVHADAAGAAASGDWPTALASCELAVEAAAQAVLAASGDIYPGRKFLLRRLRRLDERVAATVAGVRAELATAAVAVLSPDAEAAAADAGAAAARAVAGALATATDLSAAALVDWPAPDGAAGRTGHLRRSPAHCVARCDSGYLVTGATHHAVSRAVAETWLAHDGRDHDALVRFLAGRWGRDVAALDGYVTTVAATLRDAGVLAGTGP